VKKLYVGNLNFQASEEDLRDFFVQAGFAATNLTIVRDRYSHQSRGFAFVEFEDDAKADGARESLNGKDLLGRSLVVNEAREPANRGDRGSHGDRGNRSSRGGGRPSRGGGREQGDRRNW